MTDERRDKRPRILLADDHAIFVEALRALLEKKYDVIGIVADGRELLQQVSAMTPDIVIVDIGMPHLNGLDAAKRILVLLPSVKIVFLTMQSDPNLAAAAMTLGKVGFVLKGSSSSELQIAIECVLKNQSYVTPLLRSEDWAVSVARAQQYTKDLSQRQIDVIQLLAEGRAPKEVAAELNLSEKTVMFHKYNVMHAYNLKSNADLVIFALKRGLISA
jgi:DNA-binding NarL/FixJ family response regulator